MGVHDAVESGGEQISEPHFALFNLTHDARDVGLVSGAPVGASPRDVEALPGLEDRRLAAVNTAGLIDIALFSIIEIRQPRERDAVELEVAGVAMARGDPPADAIAHAMIGGDLLREPAERPRPAERRTLRIKNKKGKVAVLRGQRSGEDARIAGTGVTEDGFARRAVGENVAHERALLGELPAESIGKNEEVQRWRHHRWRSSLTCCASSIGLKGFVMNPEMPRLSASWRNRLSPRPVITMTGKLA